MTNHTELIERLDLADPESPSEVISIAALLEESKDAIEALVAERDALRAELDRARAAHRKYEEDTLKLAQSEDEERAALRAELDAIKSQEPCGYVSAGYLVLGEGRIKETIDETYKVAVYASPQPAPENQEPRT